MRQLRNLHPDWRFPLAACLGTLLGSALLSAWSWEKAVQAEAGHQQLRLARLRASNELEALRRGADDLSRALAVLKQLKKAAPDTQVAVITPLLPQEARISEMPPRADGNGPWREHLIRLQTPLLHEETLLEILGRWHNQSEIQHHLRSCRISRDIGGLKADCQLALLYLHMNESP